MLRIAGMALRCVRGTSALFGAQLHQHHHCERSEAIQSLSAVTISIPSSPRDDEAVVAGGARRAMRTHRIPSLEG
jgi:hypothetical protein